MAEVFHAEIRAEATGGETLERVRRETRELHEEIDRLHASEHRVAMFTGRLAETFALVSEHSEGLRDHMWEAREALGETGTMGGELLPMLGALGAAASVTGFVEMARETAEARTQLNAMAETLGLSARQLQAYRLVAQEADVPVEDMQGSILRLDRAMAQAASGKSKDAAAIFGKMGINLRDVNGHLRSVTEVLPLVAQSLTKTHDETLRNAVAMTLFGRSGAYLIPFLKEAAGNMDELQKRSDQLNASLSPEDNENIERFKNSWIELDTAVGGLKDTITADLAPVLTPILHEITDWIGAHREGIGETITSDFKALSSAVREIDWKTLGSETATFAHVLNEGAQAVGGWTRILEIMAVLAALKFAWSAAQPVVEMGKIGVEAVKLAWTLNHELAEAWGFVGEKAAAAGAKEEVAASVGAHGGSPISHAAPEAAAAAAGESVATKGGTVARRLAGRMGAVGIGAAALPWLGELYLAETYLPALLNAAVHADGSQDVEHPNARGYTGPTRDQRHAVDHAYGRHDGPIAHNADPFEELGELFGWINGLRNRRYDAQPSASVPVTGSVTVHVQVDQTVAQQVSAKFLDATGSARAGTVDVGHSFPMGYR